MERKIALSTGVDMGYLEAGPPSGKPVILLHGFTDSGFAWKPVIERMMELDPQLRIFALHQRGAEDTGLPTNVICQKAPAHCIATAPKVDDVLAFIRAAGLSSVTLVGHSMGSVIARNAALADPEHIDRLILISTPGPSPAGKVGFAGITAFHDDENIADTEPVRSFRAVVLAKGLVWPQDAFDLRPIDLDPDAVETMLKYWVSSPLASAATLRGTAERTARVPLKYWGIDQTPVFAPAEEIDRLTVPTLIIWGVQDNLMTDMMQRNLRVALDAATRASPHMTYVWKQYGTRCPKPDEPQNDFGHELVAEAAGKLAQDITDFIR